MTQSLQLTPETLKLQEEVTALEKQLGELILERDELLNAVKPNLEAKYQKKIGYRELERFGMELEARKMKRKIELVQKAINRQEAIITEKIEDQLDKEFKEWYKKIDERYQKLQDAENQLSGLMTKRESEEFKKLYHELVFKLHPDLNPDQTENEKILWNKVQQAYVNGDLEEVRLLRILIDTYEGTIEQSSSIEILEKRKTKLAEQIHKITGQLNKMKTQFPFNLIDKLNDTDWVQLKLKDLSKKIDYWEDKLIKFTELFEILLNSQKAGVN